VAHHSHPLATLDTERVEAGLQGQHPGAELAVAQPPERVDRAERLVHHAGALRVDQRPPGEEVGCGQGHPHAPNVTRLT